MASVPSVEPESTTTISDSPSRLDQALADAGFLVLADDRRGNRQGVRQAGGHALRPDGSGGRPGG